MENEIKQCLFNQQVIMGVLFKMCQPNTKERAALLDAIRLTEKYSQSQKNINTDDIFERIRGFEEKNIESPSHIKINPIDLEYLKSNRVFNCMFEPHTLIGMNIIKDISVDIGDFVLLSDKEESEDGSN